MALGGARRTIALCSAAWVLASCTHNTSNIQDAPSSSSGDVSSPSPTISALTTSASATGVAPIPTPTVAPVAQGAVDAFVASLNLYNAASRDPATADLTSLDAFLTGKARTIYDDSITGMRTSGYAYRGTPANPRVKVGTVLSSSAVQLTSCPQENRSDPFVEYDVKTGKALPVATSTPRPPYRLTIFMKQSGGRWLIYDVLQDASKTCTG